MFLTDFSRAKMTCIVENIFEDGDWAILVQCANLFCTYLATAGRAALARVTFARMSDALAVQMNGLGCAL
jgi:hypothetical protein